jgi:hypothetical protein
LWRRSIEKGRVVGCGYVGTSTRSSRTGVEGGRVFVRRCRNSRGRSRCGVVGESGGASGGVSWDASFGHVRCWASCAVCSSRWWPRAESGYGPCRRQQTGQKRDVAGRSEGRGARRRAHSQLGRWVRGRGREWEQHAPRLVMAEDGGEQSRGEQRGMVGGVEAERTRGRSRQGTDTDADTDANTTEWVSG